MSNWKENGMAMLSSESVTMGTAANGTKQILYTVPSGKDGIILGALIHNPTASLAGCNDVDFGVGAACATQAFLNNETGIADMTSTTDYMWLTAESNDYKVIDGDDATAANREFGIYIVAGSTLAATATIKTFGIIF